MSYIPWSKLKPDIDVELLEEGGMLDEDTIPEWLKAKIAETTNKKQQVQDPGSQDKPTGFIPLPDGTPAQSIGTPTTTVDTSQPPPLHAGGLLPPPPMAMPIVSPFSLNTRLLGPMGHMGPVPPGMMPNIPIGVPPPNLSGPLMPNQLLGMGSPFAQAPPGMMPPISQIPIPGNNQDGKPPPGPGLLPPPGAPPPDNPSTSNTTVLMNNYLPNMMLPSEENMDIEMEDADTKNDNKQMPLSDQLLAAIGGPRFNENNERGGPNDGRFKGDHPSDIDERGNRDRDSRNRDRNDRNDRGRDNNRSSRNSRDRGGRERDRDNNRESRDNRERDNRDHRDREGGRNDRRGNRWSDRDHRGNRPERDSDKKQDGPRNEKSLAERLRDMAHEGIVPSRERPARERSAEKPPPLFGNQQGPPGRPPFQKFPNGEPDVTERPPRDISRSRDELEPERRMDEIAWRERMEPEMFRHPDNFNPGDEFDPRMRRHPDDFPRMDHPDFDPRMNINRPDFEGRRGPMPYQDDIHMEQERYEFEMRQREMFDRRENFGHPDDIRMLDEFDHRGRGPDFFPPRDGFGPRPLMRGPGPDFPPRPLLGRPPGPHMFHPRGMGPRGPRPGMYL